MRVASWVAERLKTSGIKILDAEFKTQDLDIESQEIRKYQESVYLRCSAKPK